LRTFDASARFLSKCEHGVLAIATWLNRIALTLSVLFVLIEVFFRFVLNNGLAWPEELSIELFVLTVFLSLPSSFAKDNQPRLEILGKFLPKFDSLFYGISLGVIGVYLVTMFFTWFNLIPGEKGQIIPSLGISTMVPSIVLPLGIALTFLVMCIVGFKKFIESSRPVSLAIGIFVGIAFTIWLITMFQTTSPVLCFVWVILLILIGTPISVSLGVGAMEMVVSTGTSALNIVAQNVLQGANSFVLLAIPFFIITGALVAETSLGPRLVNFCKAWLGWLPGGLGVADVGASAIFANMSGSAIADTAAIGTVMIPGLVKAGYKAESAVALQAAAGVIGVVFPPATALILFGFVSQVSIIKLFESAIVPGILIAIGLALTTIFVSVRERANATIPFRLHTAGKATLAGIPSLLIPIILLGGILSGATTPTEAGAVAILVALIISACTRELTFTRILRVLDMATDNIGLVMFVTVNATAIGWAFTATQLGNVLQTWITGISHSTLMTLILINLLLIVVHFFIETAPSVLVMVPLLLPLITALNVDPLQFGVMFVVNSTIGQVMPPVGVNLFIASKIGNVPVMKAVPKIIPYVVSSLVVLCLVILFPGLSTWLPGISH
jgi:tripartite ATP-independent transporter DctM subunit